MNIISNTWTGIARYMIIWFPNDYKCVFFQIFMLWFCFNFMSTFSEKCWIVMVVVDIPDFHGTFMGPPSKKWCQLKCLQKPGRKRTSDIDQHKEITRQVAWNTVTATCSSCKGNSTECWELWQTEACRAGWLWEATMQLQLIFIMWA